MNSSTLNLRIEVDDKGSIKVRALGKDLDETGEKGKRAASGMDHAFGQLKATIGGIAILALGKQVLDVMDQYTQLESRLRLVTKGEQNLASVQQELYQISLRTHQANADTVDLYTRMSRATQQLGMAQSTTLQITETINQALIVSGASAVESSAGLVQFAQGLSSGVLRGEEFNSVMEQTPRLAQAIADGLGVTIGQLRAMANDGKLTADIVTKALISQKETIEREYSQMSTTIGQSFTDLSTVVKSIIHDADKSGGATGEIVSSIEGLATTIDTNREGILSLFSEIIKMASTSVDWIVEMSRDIGLIDQNTKEGLVEQLKEQQDLLKKNKELLSDYQRNFSWVPGANNIISWQKKETQESAAEVERLTKKIAEMQRMTAQGGKDPIAEQAKEKALAEERAEAERKLKKAEEDKNAAAKKAIEDQAKTTQEMYKEAQLGGEQYFNNEAEALIKKAARWKEAGAEAYQVEEWLYGQLGTLSEKAWAAGETAAGQTIDDIQAMSQTLLDNVGAAHVALAGQIDDVSNKISALNNQDISITANFDGSAVVAGIDSLIAKFQALRAAASASAPAGSGPSSTGTVGSSSSDQSSASSVSPATDIASGGTTIINHFNQQMSRSDVNSYISEQKRQEARK